MFFKSPIKNKESLNNWNTNGFPRLIMFEKNPFEGFVFSGFNAYGGIVFKHK